VFGVVLVLFATTLDFYLLAMAVDGGTISVLVNYKSWFAIRVVQNHLVVFKLYHRNFVVKRKAVWVI
jgi:hypothetical protein